MSYDGIQWNDRPGSNESPLINVCGKTPEEFARNYAFVIANLPALAQARPLNDDQPLSLEQIKQELGATVVAEYNNVPPMAPTPPPAPTTPQDWQQPPAAPPGWPQYQPQTPPQQPATPQPCDYCQKVPVCGTCNGLAKLERKTVKSRSSNDQFFVHDCLSSDRSHKGQWCNAPK